MLNSSATLTFQVGANDSETISMATVSLGSLISPVTGGGGGGGGGAGPDELVGPDGEIVTSTSEFNPQTNPQTLGVYRYGDFGGSTSFYCTPAASESSLPASVSLVEVFPSQGSDNTYYDPARSQDDSGLPVGSSFGVEVGNSIAYTDWMSFAGAPLNETWTIQPAGAGGGGGPARPSPSAPRRR